MINMIEILNKAAREKYAVPQFNINNLEWTRYILEECEELRMPVILGASEGAIKHMGGYNVVYSVASSLVKDLNITVPVVLHLDHASSVESCKKAIDAGFTSVMLDASKRSLDENIEMTKEVVEYARKRNVSVEAETGHVGIKGDIVTEDCYAKVDECMRLYNETKIDALAPGIGNLHSMYNVVENLNIDRLKEINEAMNMPLVLHGGTGVSNDDIRKCIENGMAKININTELQVVWAKAVREYLDKDKEVYDPRKIISSGEQAIKECVRDKATLFGCINKI